MLKEYCRNFVLRRGLSSNFDALGLCILHAAFDARSYHLQFQLTEDASHFHESLAHGLHLSRTAVNGDAAHDDHPQSLFPYDIDDLTQLLCASASTAHFQRDDGVAFLHGITNEESEKGIPTDMKEIESF